MLEPPRRSQESQKQAHFFHSQALPHEKRNQRGEGATCLGAPRLGPGSEGRVHEEGRGKIPSKPLPEVAEELPRRQGQRGLDEDPCGIG